MKDLPIRQKIEISVLGTRAAIPRNARRRLAGSVNGGRGRALYAIRPGAAATTGVPPAAMMSVP